MDTAVAHYSCSILLIFLCKENFLYNLFDILEKLVLFGLLDKIEFEEVKQVVSSITGQSVVFLIFQIKLTPNEIVNVIKLVLLTRGVFLGAT